MAKSDFAGTTIRYEKLPNGEWQATADGVSCKFRMDAKDYPDNPGNQGDTCESCSNLVIPKMLLPGIAWAGQRPYKELVAYVPPRRGGSVAAQLGRSSPGARINWELNNLWS